MWNERRLIVLVVALALLTASTDAAQRPSAPQEPRIEWTALPADLPQSLRDSVRFGYFEVPEDHNVPNGPRIRIAIALLPALSSTPAPDPLVFIFGGPGVAEIKTFIEPVATLPPLQHYRQRRDIIIIDPRGHGYSGPARCDDLFRGGLARLGITAAAEQRILETMTECRKRLTSQSVRLETLNAVQVAHDLEWLRKALGAPALNLYALSYGTRLAAEAMRQVPSAIRAVHLHLPVPPGFAENDGESKEAFGALFRLCAAQAGCRAAYPRLEADYESVLAAIRRAPVKVPVPPAKSSEGAVVMDEGRLRDVLSRFLVRRDRAARLPFVINSLAQNGFTDLPRFLAEVPGGGVERRPSLGTFVAFLCNDGATTPASPEKQQQACRIWLGDAYTGREAAPIRSDLPVLITAGDIDPRTPPSNARRLVTGLLRAHIVIAPGYGHEWPPDCIFAISRAFLDAPDRAPDTTCVASIPPIPFVTGSAAKPAEARPSLVLGAPGEPSLEAQPAGWGVMTLDGSSQAAYAVEATGRVTDAEGAVVTFKCVNPPCGGPAVAAVALPVAPFTGRVATLSGELQTAGVKLGAAIGLNAQRDGRELMRKGGDMLRGDRPWTRDTVSMAVPAEATSLLVGVLLQPGGGEVTVRGLRVEAAPRPAVGSTIAPAARALLDAALSIVKTHALRADSVDWSTVEPEVRGFATGAQHPGDVHAAIEYLLFKLGDHHSFFLSPAATSKLKSGGAENRPADVRPLPDRIGYIGVPGYWGAAPAAAREFATRAHEAIAAVKAAAACGWVVDLRDDNGGNVWPMVAALRPLLGDGVLGSWEERNGKITKWSAKSQVDAPPPAALKDLQSAWVAVLTGPRTASSGEFVAIAFRGRPRTRSFGLATAGFSTANEDFQLPDGSTIFLTIAVGADRTGERYGGKLQPDEVIEARPSADGEDAALSAAVRWLKRISGCDRRD